MITIYAIKTNKGYYISEKRDKNDWHRRDFKQYLFDGETSQPSFHDDWRIISNKPTKISHIENQSNINHRFVLTDDSLASDKIPLEIKKEDAGKDEKDCEDRYSFVWKPELALYRSLYVEVSDEQPDKEVLDEFEFIELFEVAEIKPPPDLKYPINKRWDDIHHEFHPDALGKDKIEHQILDRIIFPTILIHETPCQLSSEETYKVVRQHVKENINLKVARITSDYDFCFEVAKIIPLAEPYNRTDVYSKRGSRGKKETHLISTKEVKCFEMTYNPYNYKGYTPIDGFEGKTEADLKSQIDKYLVELMAFINEPVKECPNCKGKGVLLNSEIEPIIAKHRVI